MRQILGALTNNRLVGTLVGVAVTAIIQSSSATTVMVVGFVNAGLMSLVQSIGVVLGANIGTTVTAQLLAFKITQYALPAIGVGTALKLFSRSKSGSISARSSSGSVSCFSAWRPCARLSIPCGAATNCNSSF
jgi:phosphate:Na+ symporter